MLRERASTRCGPRRWNIDVIAGPVFQRAVLYWNTNSLRWSRGLRSSGRFGQRVVELQSKELVSAVLVRSAVGAAQAETGEVLEDQPVAAEPQCGHARPLVGLNLAIKAEDLAILIASATNGEVVDWAGQQAPADALPTVVLTPESIRDAARGSLTASRRPEE